MNKILALIFVGFMQTAFAQVTNINMDEQESVYIPNFITPNGDGRNDKIVINNLNTFGEDESTLIIYNRYGKELYKASNNQRIEWDGFYLGRPLNSTDYWYQLMLPDGRIKTGHITVKNF